MKNENNLNAENAQKLAEAAQIYQEGQEVDLIISHQSDLGYNAQINNLHWGVIYRDEVFKPLFDGQKIKGFVKKIREDGKIDLTIYKTGYASTFEVADKIIELLKLRGGVLQINDKTPAEKIYTYFGVSKKKYKIALGGLYKKRLITVHEDRIQLNLE